MTAPGSAQDIAIIGMSGRFPGADTVDKLWTNLRNGVESIARFSEADLLAEGLSPDIARRPGYVNAGGVLEGADLFDAAFFGFSPREAEIMDPQQRAFLECAWEALEAAGYDAAAHEGLIGVYAGGGASHHLIRIASDTGLVNLVGSLQVSIGNEKDHLTTMAAYKLGLTGPAVTVQTTCSSSLVAICQACHALLGYQCDMALAGGVSISPRQRTGYYFREGGILSPDGHCRAFDARARGTVAGNGVGLVVLKRLEEALADGDTIRAVIKGSAVNNDGSVKVGYTAPSVEGQRAVIALALAIAGMAPETIGYVEAHGTGTALGDPIEIAALTQAFRTGTDARQFCAVGSIKSNIGHLDAAAGVAGLIKVVLALEHRTIPPSLWFESPNPEIDFANSPFYVPTSAAPWPDGETPRRGAVSSFGIGGTNAHVVLEEAPRVASSLPARPVQLAVLSARSAVALDVSAARLAAHLEHASRGDLPDAAYTLQVGRRPFPHRLALVASEPAGAARDLRERRNVHIGVAAPTPPPVAFLFPGQGTQYAGMGAELYASEPVFRETFDACTRRLAGRLGIDIGALVWDPGRRPDEVDRTLIAQPALFSLEYALAALWMSWGLRPAAMIGHSIGEYVAACLAGVFTLDDALDVVAERARLSEAMEGGVMVAVRLSADKARRLAGPGLAVAAVNEPGTCVVSGPLTEVERLEAALQAVGIASMRLRTSHAFHSPMMEAAVEPLVRAIRSVPRSVPRIPYLSNLTGTWIQDGEATDPAYWGAHLRQTVRFADGVATLLAEHSPLCIEVGPGRSLSRLVRRHPRCAAATVLVSSLPSQAGEGSEAETVLGALGELWVAGAAVDWRAVSAGERRRRIPMPSYPFERQRFVAPMRGTAGNRAAPPAAGAGTRNGSSPVGPGPIDWLYTPTWTRSLLPGSPAPAHGPWLVLADRRGLGDALARGLTERGQEVVTVRRLDPVATSAERSRAGAPEDLAIDPRDAEALGRILGLLEERGGAPAHIVHLWGIDGPGTDGPRQGFNADAFRSAQEGGLLSVLALARAVVGARVAPRITLITDRAHDVTGDEALRPEGATLLGIRHVLPQEHPGLRCFGVDVVAPAPGAAPDRRLVDQLVAELEAGASDPVVAYRGGYRWRADIERFTAQPGTETLLRARGVYVVTGGLGRIGRKLAAHLAGRWQARLVLVGRHVPEGADRAALVAEIERLGGQVLLHEGDAGDPGHLRAIARLAEERFGPVNGVIHAAGATGAAGFGPALSTGEARCQAHFHPKVDGVLAIDEVFGRRGLDFVLLCSSLSTVLGGLGFGAYAAANAVLDTYASLRNRAGPTTWLSVAWDGWSFGPAPDGRPGQPAIDPDEGMEAFDLLCRGRPPARVIVAAGSLPERIANWISAPVGVRTRPEQGGAVPEMPTAPAGGHARPNLETGYVPPGTELERGVAAVWEQLFGIEGIGILDDFFELGGHSLLAIQLIARLRDTYGVDLPVKELFDDPTVAGLADSIGVLQRASQDPAMSLAAALELVEGLSESEVAALLGDAGPVALPAIGPASRGTDESPNDAVRRFYDAVNARLDVIEAGRYSMFLNFGYADDGAPGSPPVRLPAHLFNRNSVRLVLETVGGCDLAGTRVLDVGCGRGGTLDTLRTYCDPHALVGLDLSTAAIAFCSRTQRDPALRFLVADAARLPFAEGSFDAVTNIESSHTYPDIDRFYAEVHRVLAPGGILLYTDLVPAEQVPQRLRSLSEAGLHLEVSRDVTRNVLVACDETAEQRLGAFGTGNDARTMDNFLAVPGSKVYEDMASGRSIYGIWRARKP